MGAGTTAAAPLGGITGTVGTARTLAGPAGGTNFAAGGVSVVSVALAAIVGLGGIAKRGIIAGFAMGEPVDVAEVPAEEALAAGILFTDFFSACSAPSEPDPLRR